MTEDKIETYINDILRIYPDRVLLNKKELSQIRNCSLSTLNREQRDGKGIPQVEIGGKKMYAVRDVAIWLIDNTTRR